MPRKGQKDSAAKLAKRAAARVDFFAKKDGARLAKGQQQHQPDENGFIMLADDGSTPPEPSSPHPLTKTNHHNHWLDPLLHATLYVLRRAFEFTACTGSRVLASYFEQAALTLSA